MINLKLLRIKMGLTQYKLARMIHMSQSKYSSIERGDIEANPLDKKMISKGLSVSYKSIWKVNKGKK
jgi:transcriptional regulator with XRE-family HTH domain